VEEHLKNLKKTLDNRLYEGRAFPEDKKLETYQLMKAKKKRRKSILSFGKIAIPSLFAFGILFVLIFPFLQDQENPHMKQELFLNMDQDNQQEEMVSPILQEQPINMLITRTKANGDVPIVNRAMILSIHPDHSIRMLNIDTRLNLTPNESEPANMTDLLQSGNMELVQAEIEDLLEIEVDYQFAFTNESFINLMNKIGEISVGNGFAFENNGVAFPVGDLKLNAREAILFEEHIENDPYGNGAIGGAEVRQTNLFLSILKAVSEQPAEDLQSVFMEWLSAEEIDKLLASYLVYDVDIDLMAFVLQESSHIGYVEVPDNEHNKEVVRDLEKPFKALELAE
jgi:polyisoprenyl-teichoic acid--peptidoglycan teichoic acid transferase